MELKLVKIKGPSENRKGTELGGKQWGRGSVMKGRPSENKRVELK